MLAVILSVACCILSVSAAGFQSGSVTGSESVDAILGNVADASNQVLGDISKTNLWPAFVALAAGLLMSLAACFKLPQNLMRFLALCVIGATAYFVYWFSFAGGVDKVLAAE